MLGEMEEDYPDVKERMDSYLGAVTPSLESVDRRFEGSYVTVEVRNRTGPNGATVSFGPESVSDGTIRAAAVLAALFQPSVLDGRTSLVGLEDPEIALHPAAAGVLFDALTEASERVQVIATTQSDDLVDREDLDPTIIRAVGSQGGLTVIGDVNAASLRALQEHRFTVGELMRARSDQSGCARYGCVRGWRIVTEAGATIASIVEDHGEVRSVSLARNPAPGRMPPVTSS